mmetsp:Transcript_10265/g.22823  ORF Transcript_10265/g.22823 Transcript_10265/m.22823 type:complete len:337 (+) Transcript_10265:293-1303(+)
MMISPTATTATTSSCIFAIAAPAIVAAIATVMMTSSSSSSHIAVIVPIAISMIVLIGITAATTMLLLGISTPTARITHGSTRTTGRRSTPIITLRRTAMMHHARGSSSSMRRTMLLRMMMLHHVLLRIIHSLLCSVGNAGGATGKHLHLRMISRTGSHLRVETAAGSGTSSALWRLHAVGSVAGVGSRRDGAVAWLLHVLLLLLLLLLGGGGIARAFSRVYRCTVLLSWRTSSLGRYGWDHGLLLLLGSAILRWILLAHLGMLGVHDGHHARHSKLRTTRSHIPHHGRSPRIFPMRIMHHLSLFHHRLLLLHWCRWSRSRNSKHWSKRFGTGIEGK